MLYICYVFNNNYIVEWEIITSNYITVTWCLLGYFNYFKRPSSEFFAQRDCRNLPSVNWNDYKRARCRPISRRPNFLHASVSVAALSIRMRKTPCAVIVDGIPRNADVVRRLNLRPAFLVRRSPTQGFQVWRESRAAWK